MPVRPTLALALSLAALSLTACGENEPDAPLSPEDLGQAPAGAKPAPAEQAPPTGDAPTSVKVDIRNFDYMPDPVRVKSGGTITWKNFDSSEHTSEAEPDQAADFDTDVIEENRSKKLTFDTPGRFAYFCDFHPTMTATVEVVE